MKRPVLRLWNEDLLDLVPSLPDRSVDMVFTSYPYKRKDGYSHELMQALGEILARVLKPGARVFLNGAQLRESFERPSVARDMIYEGSNRALLIGQEIAWVKSIALPTWRAGALERVKDLLRWIDSGSVRCSRSGVRDQLADLRQYLEGPGDMLQQGHYQPITLKSPTLNYCWESIFTLYKPPEKPLDRLSIGVPFADKRNLERGTRGKHGDLHCAGDVWFVPYPTTGRGKKKATAGMKDAYSFPVELVERAIKLCKLRRGSVVLDPFMGSGRTAIAAKRLGMSAWGVERDKRKVKVIEKAWRTA